MLPQNVFPIVDAEEVETPTTTYRLDRERGRIVGMIDGVDAMVQAIGKIFDTERFAWPIYSQNYGIEVEKLIGQEMSFVKSVIESRIREAVLADDRVLEITNFTVEQSSKTALAISCTIITTQGTFELQKELNLE